VHAERQTQGLDKRLATAEKKRAALPPARGRGKRQSRAEATRRETLDHVRKEQRVAGVLTVAGERQVERHTHDVGRGRGSATRAQRRSENLRSHLTRLPRQDGALTTLSHRVGWKVFVTNAPQERRSWADAVVGDRHASRSARLCNHLKSPVQIAPRSVKRDDPSEGLTSLLPLGIRVFTVMECVLRRSLQHDQGKRPGGPPENRQQRPATPTAARLRKAFAEVSLTMLKTIAGEDLLCQLTPVSEVQRDILPRLGLGVSLDQQLEMHDMGNG
jgi:transposase